MAKTNRLVKYQYCDLNDFPAFESLIHSSLQERWLFSIVGRQRAPVILLGLAKMTYGIRLGLSTW